MSCDQVDHTVVNIALTGVEETPDAVHRATLTLNQLPASNEREASILSRCIDDRMKALMRKLVAVVVLVFFLIIVLVFQSVLGKNLVEMEEAMQILHTEVDTALGVTPKS